MKIISPSYRRAGNASIVDYLGKDVILAVHKCEAEGYQKAYPKNKIMKLPDSLKGNISKVRNFIMDNCTDKHLVMADDDLKYVAYYEDGKLHVAEPEYLKAFLSNGFRMCEEAHTVLWGLNIQADLRFYRARTPFSLLCPVLGPFSCHVLNHAIRYDTRLCLKEDYDFFFTSNAPIPSGSAVQQVALRG